VGEAAEEEEIVMEANAREPFGGKWYGIWNVEGDGEPLALFPTREDAELVLAERRLLPVDDDDRMTKYHQVFPCDLVGCWWNSYDPDPREHDPLTLEEIAAAHGGDV
jgi:hypothetical protein